MALSVETYRRTVTTAGTAVPLSATKKLVPAFSIRALFSNTGIMYVGSSTSANSTDGYPLQPSESNDKSGRFVRYGVQCLYDLNKVYLDASVSGESVIVEYEVDL